MYYEKIFRRLNELVTPQTVEDVMKYFVMSRSHASKVLRTLAIKGKVTVVRHGKKKFYQSKNKEEMR